MGRSGVSCQALACLLVLVVAAAVTSGCGGSAAASVASAQAPPPSTPAPLPGVGPVRVVHVPAVPADPRVLVRVRPPADVGTIALTFDDGPDPVWTPRVLALLRAEGDVATFCMIGREAAQRPDLVRAVAAAGMRLCDHTQDHDEKLRARPPAVLDAEVTGGWAAIRSAAAGAPVGYYRSPGGGWSPAQVDLAAAEGMQPLGWSVDPQDWRRPGAAAIVTRVQRAVRSGAVVLLHDGGGDRAQTVAALAILLSWLHAGHYRTVFPTP